MGAVDRKWITLNVGGTKFTTSRLTLNKSTPQNSPLHRITSNSTNVEWDRDETGAYLIDRDPTYFQPILNYLRHGQLILNHNVSEEGVLIEAEYFNLGELVKLLKQRLQVSRNYLSNSQQLQQSPARNPVNFANPANNPMEHHFVPIQQQQMKQVAYPANVSSPINHELLNSIVNTFLKY